MTKLTQDRLKELLNYSPVTGSFTRLVKVGGSPIGTIAGTLDFDGYRCIRVDGLKRKAHRLAFLYMTGAIPDGVIDHINGDPDDNSWNNLRVATPSQNAANSRTRKDIPKGVFPHNGRYRAIICKDSRNRHLGMFDSADEAKAAYEAAAKQLFGQFARAQ